jgi:hypothetical protein
LPLVLAKTDRRTTTQKESKTPKNPPLYKRKVKLSPIVNEKEIEKHLGGDLVIFFSIDKEEWGDEKY